MKLTKRREILKKRDRERQTVLS